MFMPVNLLPAVPQPSPGEKELFYVQAYMEETKLEGVRPGYRAEITPLGSNRVLKVPSIAWRQG